MKSLQEKKNDTSAHLDTHTHSDTDTLKCTHFKNAETPCTKNHYVDLTEPPGAVRGFPSLFQR